MSHANAADALRGIGRRLKHDLGKYIAFRTRWMGQDAVEDDRREALRADLLETRRGPEGVVDAGTIWQMARPQLFGEAPLFGEVCLSVAHLPSVARIDDAMHSLEPVIAALRADTCGPDLVTQGIALAHEVAEACRELDAALRTMETPDNG